MANQCGSCGTGNFKKSILNEKGIKKSLSEIIKEYKSNKQYLDSLVCMGDFIVGTRNDKYVFDRSIHIKRDTHQRRLNYESLAVFYRYMVSIGGIEGEKMPASTFDQLWEMVNCAKTTNNMSGIGPVTIYDVTLRWGNKHGIEPEYVYLHSIDGPLKGAQQYFKLKNITKVTNFDGKYINVSQLRSGCRIDRNNFPDFVKAGLSCRDIEHLLCIYHDRF